MNAATPSFRLEHNGPAAKLSLAGRWTLSEIVALHAGLAAATVPASAVTIDGEALERLDTAAALALFRRLTAAGARVERLERFKPAHRQVMEAVRKRLDEVGAENTPPSRRGALAAVGALAFALRDLIAGHLNFLGKSAIEFRDVVLAPGTLRSKELVAQFERTCIDAIPVVALVTFLIGVVFAYLLGMQTEKYGANIFVVDGVAIGACRELSPIIVAVIVAGRSGAAFTAELGTMRLTEEIDAIRTIGLSPMKVLVVPRLLALMVALPLLVFVGDLASIAGAISVAAPMLDIAPDAFLGRLHAALPLRHVAVGLGKAPAFAAVVAIIGCRMGITVSRDTRSIGINTTSTVVQSIVAVILLDALFAVFFQELGI